MAEEFLAMVVTSFSSTCCMWWEFFVVVVVVVEEQGQKWHKKKLWIKSSKTTGRRLFFLPLRIWSALGRSNRFWWIRRQGKGKVLKLPRFCCRDRILQIQRKQTWWTNRSPAWTTEETFKNHENWGLKKATLAKEILLVIYCTQQKTKDYQLTGGSKASKGSCTRHWCLFQEQKSSWHL